MSGSLHSHNIDKWNRSKDSLADFSLQYCVECCLHLHIIMIITMTMTMIMTTILKM